MTNLAITLKHDRSLHFGIDLDLLLSIMNFYSHRVMYSIFELITLVLYIYEYSEGQMVKIIATTSYRIPPIPPSLIHNVYDHAIMGLLL